MAVNARTRVPHIVLAILMTLTGLFLTFKAPNGFDSIFITKYILILVAIGLGVVGVKRMNKIISLGAWSILIFVLAISWRKDFMLKNVEDQVKSALFSSNTTQTGKIIFETACQRCHGPKGDFSYRKSSFLNDSKMDNESKKAIIKNGLNTMPKFDFLNEEQLNAVVEYINFSKK